MSENSTVKQRVEYGLETVPEDQKVPVRLRDLLFVHQTLGELIQFFHQPLHYPDLETIQRFLGNRDSGGAYQVLSEAYYERMREMLPPDIENAFAEGARFEHPISPKYGDKDEHGAYFNTPTNLLCSHAGCARPAYARHPSRPLVGRRVLNRYATRHIFL